MKKLIFFGIFFALLFIPSLTQAFSDVPENNPYYSAVKFLSERNVIQGYSDDTFKPDQKINRAEVVKIVTVGLLNIDVTKNSYKLSNLPLSDLKDTWYVPYITECYNKKIATGYSDHTFKPAQTINLAESLKIILESYGFIDNFTVQTPPFVDVPINAWFAKYAESAKGKNLVSPQGNGNLDAGQEMTRGAFAEIIYRLLWLKENKQEQFDLSLNWPTFEKSLHFYKIKYPPNWQIISENTSTIFWRQDAINSQRNYQRQYPLSASINIVLDENKEGLNMEEYFKKIGENFPLCGEKCPYRFKINDKLEAIRIDMELEMGKISDLYVFLPNNKVLILYGTYGKGALTDYISKQIIATQKSVNYVEGGVDMAKALEEARKNINVDGKGKATLKLFKDLVLFETDSIGVGTGPVDYYYSQAGNATLKYERSLDVILDIKEGKTGKF